MSHTHPPRSDQLAGTTQASRFERCVAAMATGVVIATITLLVLRQARPGVLPGNDALLILPVPILLGLLAGLTWPEHDQTRTRERG